MMSFFSLNNKVNIILKNRCFFFQNYVFKSSFFKIGIKAILHLQSRL